MRTVLISGAGIAGATLAYWLTRRGLRPTVVEQAQGTRSSGNPVDVRRPALPIVESMGLLPALRDRATLATKVALVGPDGRVIAMLSGPNRAGRNDAETEIELGRADLARLLLESCRDAELIFDESIAALNDDGAGVDVRLSSGTARRFDLVIGADGVHSATRKLIFGPEEQFARPIGMYVGTTEIDLESDPDNPDGAVQLFNTPRRLTAIHPGRGRPGVAFIFRRRPIAGFDPRDTAQHKKLILDAYVDDGWRVPEMLDQVRVTDDLYFDAVTRINLPRWSIGRVGLVGDAASSVSLLGDGSTKAIVGAYTLAEELSGTDDHQVAFRRYQDRHSRLISSRARVRFGAATLVPRTAAGIAIRNGLARLLR